MAPAAQRGKDGHLLLGAPKEADFFAGASGNSATRGGGSGLQSQKSGGYGGMTRGAQLRDVYHTTAAIASLNMSELRQVSVFDCEWPDPNQLHSS